MARFSYKAATTGGGLHEGEMRAALRDEVVRRLQRDGYVPIRVVEAGTSPSIRMRPARPSRTRLGTSDLAFFSMELSTFLEAGVPLGRALAMLASLAERAPVRALLERLNRRVRGGESFADALAQDDAGFTSFYLSMVRAGERGGMLGQALHRLAEFLERATRLRETLLAALWYPAILVVVAILSLGIIVGVVVPRFAEMFAEAGQKLPLPTQALLAVGGFVQEWGWLLAVVIALIAWVARHLFAQPAVRHRVESTLLRLPLAGTVVSEVEAARFTRALGTLLTGGVTLVDALPIACDAVGNLAVAEGLARAIPQVRSGRGLATPLAEADVFPRLAVELVNVGEETGQLGAMLGRVADTYERGVEVTLRRLVAFAGPVVILTLGALIGSVILSILVAVLGVNQLVQ